MQEYLDSKVVEYLVLFDWIQSEINRLKTNNTDHTQLVNLLLNKYTKLRESYEQLKAIVNLKNKRLAQRAIPIIHDIEYQILVLVYFYIPGLQREGENDLFIRKILLSVLKRCGVSWVDDILVRLDSQYATFPAITEFPIIFAPPHQVTSTLDMAALYHELGHDVYQHFPSVEQNLAMSVFEHFNQSRLNIGPMSPEKRDARNKLIDNALSYWSGERLNELFSDIFATFVCGPAYYFSIIDVAIRTGQNPFHIEIADVHPPWTARIDACYKTLLPIHQNANEVGIIRQAWGTYATPQPKDTNFDFLYPGNLIKQLVNVAVQNIEKHVPNAQRFSKALQGVAITDESYSEQSLENILNERFVILLKTPDQYVRWENNIFDVLQDR